MEISAQKLGVVLSQLNPWWSGQSVVDLPPWRRAAWRELQRWVMKPPARRAILLAGARQIGKTTLLLQEVNDLLSKGTPASNILYATFDHPLLKLAGIDAVLEAWHQREPKARGPDICFWTRRNSSATGALGSSIKWASTASGASFSLSRDTRNQATGTPYGSPLCPSTNICKSKNCSCRNFRPWAI